MPPVPVRLTHITKFTPAFADHVVSILTFLLENVTTRTLLFVLEVILEENFAFVQVRWQMTLLAGF